MRTYRAYCSACDQEVPVVAEDGSEGDGLRPADPSDLACMAFGEACTGDMCPLFDVPTDEMRERWRAARNERA